MATSLTSWMIYLRVSDTLICVPLLVTGCAVMFYGWRIWRFCIVTAFGLIGFFLGHLVISDSSLQGAGSIAMGAAFALATYKPAKYAAGLLGGLVIAFLVIYVLEDLGFRGGSLWMSGAASVFMGAAYSFINRKLVIIGVTASMGAGLLLSGMTVLLMEWDVVYGNVKALATDSAIVLPFLIMVPTFMSALHQLSEMRRLNIEL